MMAALPLQSIDVQQPGTTPEQLLIAAAIIGLVATVAIVVRLLSASLGLPDLDEDDELQNRSHRAAVRKSLERADARTLRLSRSEFSSVGADRLRRLWTDEPPTGPTGTAGAARSASSAVREAWRAQTGSVPGQVLVLGRYAALVVLLGSVAVSTATVVRLLGTEPSYPTLGGTIDTVTSVLGDLGGGTTSALGAFPGADLLWALALTAVLTTGEFLYNRWYLVAVLLIGAAAALVFFDAYIDDRRQVRIIRGRLDVAGVAVVWLTIAYLLGTVPSAVGGALGVPTVGAGVGIMLVLGWLAVGVRLAWPFTRVALRRALREAGDADRPVLLANLLVERLASLLATTAAALVVVYLVAGITGGGFGAVATAYAQAGLDIQLLIAIAALAMLVVLAWQVRAAWPRLRDLLADLQARARVRALAIRGGGPVLGVVAGYIAVWFVGQSIGWAVLGAVVTGLFVHVALGAVRRARYGLSPDRTRREGPSQALLRARWCRDAADRPRVHCEVAGSVTIVRDDVEAAIGDIQTVLDAWGEGESAPATVGSYYATKLFDYGISGEDALAKKGRTDARKRIDSAMRDLPTDRIRRTHLFATSDDRSLRDRIERSDSRPQQLPDFDDLPDAFVEAAIEKHPGYLDTGAEIIQTTDVYGAATPAGGAD